MKKRMHKEICQECRKEYPFKDTRIVPWDSYDYQTWDIESRVECPRIFLKPMSEWQVNFLEPHDGCPYQLEHLILSEREDTKSMVQCRCQHKQSEEMH